jgi:hypothetical protein
VTRDARDVTVHREVLVVQKELSEEGDLSHTDWSVRPSSLRQPRPQRWNRSLY